MDLSELPKGGKEGHLRHQARKSGARAGMILQYAHYLKQKWQQKGFTDVEVRVTACVSLNGRPAELIIDPQRDLTKVARQITHSDWFLPQTAPFERPLNQPDPPA